MKKIFALTFLALTFFVCSFVMTGCYDFISGQDYSQSGTQSGSSNQGHSQSGTQSGSHENEDEWDKNIKVGKIGQIITTNGWDISLVYVKTFTEINGRYSPDYPDEGKEFLVFFVECRRNAEEDDILMSSNFVAYADDLALSTPFLIMNNPDNWESDWDADMNHRVRLAVIYEVVPGWQNAEVSYKDNVFMTKVDAKFTLTREELTEPNFIPKNSPFGEYKVKNELTPFGTTLQTRNVEIEFIEAKEYLNIGYKKADDGKIYVVLFFEVRNKSNSITGIINYSLDFYVDGYSLEEEISLSNIDGYSSLSGDIEPGKSRIGFLLVQTDPNYNYIELVCKDPANNKITFVFSKDMIDNT